MKPVWKIGRVVSELFVLESLFSAVAKLSEEVSEELTDGQAMADGNGDESFLAL